MTYRQVSAVLLRPWKYSAAECAEARQIYREGASTALRVRLFRDSAQRHRLRLSALDAVLIGLLVLAVLVA